MALHEITDKYKEINETKGTLQNLSVHTIEIGVDPNMEGLLVRGGEKLSFALETNQKLYARTVHFKNTANIVIVNFKQPAGSGSGSAGTDGRDGREIELIADDEYIKWRYVGEEWQNLIAKSELGGGGGATAGYAQITKLGVTATTAAPKIVEIPIKSTTTFCLPPVEVLKFAQGAQDVVSTVCEFNNADATDFVYDAEYMVFDGTMKLKTSFDVKMSAPTALVDGFISESEEIDFAEYKKVEEVG